MFADCATKTDGTMTLFNLLYFSPDTSDEDDDSLDDEKRINITSSWTEFYWENRDNRKWKMDPPSVT